MKSPRGCDFLSDSWSIPAFSTGSLNRADYQLGYHLIMEKLVHPPLCFLVSFVLGQHILIPHATLVLERKGGKGSLLPIASPFELDSRAPRRELLVGCDAERTNVVGPVGVGQEDRQNVLLAT